MKVITMINNKTKDKYQHQLKNLTLYYYMLIAGTVALALGIIMITINDITTGSEWHNIVFDIVLLFLTIVGGISFITNTKQAINYNKLSVELIEKEQANERDESSRS